MRYKAIPLAALVAVALSLAACGGSSKGGLDFNGSFDNYLNQFDGKIKYSKQVCTPKSDTEARCLAFFESDDGSEHAWSTFEMTCDPVDGVCITTLDEMEEIPND